MKAATTSHTVEFEKPESASLIVRTRLALRTAIAIQEIVPIGKGCKMKATMVDTKIARSFHALGSFRPSGMGINQINTPIAMAKAPFAIALL